MATDRSYTECYVATEVDNQLQSQNLKENGRHAFEDRYAAETRRS